MRARPRDGNLASLPAEAIELVGIALADSLLAEVRDSALYLRPEPKDWEEILQGLGKEIWEGVDLVEYVRRERGGVAAEKTRSAGAR